MSGEKVESEGSWGNLKYVRTLVLSPIELDKMRNVSSPSPIPPTTILLLAAQHPLTKVRGRRRPAIGSSHRAGGWPRVI